MSTGPTLDDVFLIEVIALMAEGVLERPCPYLTHPPFVEFDDGGPPGLRGVSPARGEG
jgi:hypothetical protein